MLYRALVRCIVHERAVRGRFQNFRILINHHMELRPYQTRIVEAIGDKSAIVKMPTGSGKTVVAAAVIQRKLRAQYKILFLVPTRELVNQQAQVVEKWCIGAAVGIYHGGSTVPNTFQVLVSTPQAFRSLQARKGGYEWSAFGLVIYDEVHHVLKDHPYRHIALSIKNWHRDQGKLQVLGLSASLTYDVVPVRIKATLDRLCRELSIEVMLSPSVAELEADGYVSQHGRNVEVALAREVPEGVTMESARKPHLMHSTFMNRVSEGTATEFALDVFHIVQALEAKAKQAYPSFKSPLSSAKLSSWEAYVHKLSTQCSGNHRTLFRLLESWYVSLRVLAQTWEEEDQVVMQWLKMTNAATDLPSSMLYEAHALRIRSKLQNEHNLFKLGCLHSHIATKKAVYGDSFKCIVFVQQRFTAMVLADYLNRCESSLHPGYVASRGSSVTPSITVTKTDVSETIAAFRSGHSSVLVATSVVEEGFDVPEANVVILYDCMKDSVELCQRFGRARATQCSIIVMDERPDRPLAYLERVRQDQDQLVQDYDAKQQSQVDPDVERQKQLSRERAGFQHVLSNQQKCNEQPVQAVNEYVKKTKGFLSETNARTPEGYFRCQLTYSSNLRRMMAVVTEPSKKAAKRQCCCQLLTKFKSSTQL